MLAESKVGAHRSAGTEQRIEVRFDYPVWFTRGALDALNPLLAEAVAREEPSRAHRVLAVVDRGLLAGRPALVEELGDYVAAHREQLELAGPVLVETGGEAAKQDGAAVERVQRAIHAARLDRHSAVIAIGGGALLDAVGYACATAHRGLRLVRMPTTVLAQNDAGVGVKNAINAFGVKNFLGTFAPPFAVIDDFDFLATLDPRDRRAGIAEAIKVALIRDREFHARLEADADALTRFEDAAVEHMVRRGAELHLEHIATSGDPFESGSARPLDYGHWAAHKLESLSGHTLRHGEAVAIGMALDGAYAVRTGLLAADRHERICSLLERLGFRLWDPALGARSADGRLAVLEGLDEFRQHLGGELTLTMLMDIGEPVEIHAVDPQQVLAAVEALEQRDRARCG